jgi:hypothetical protein
LTCTGIDCKGSGYNAAFIISLILLLLFPVGIPIFFGTVMFWNRSRLAEDQDNDIEFEAFAELIREIRHDDAQMDEAALQAMFADVDSDASGSISPLEMFRYAFESELSRRCKSESENQIIGGQSPEGTQIHARGVGVHGWDGTPDGEGEFESEDALGKIFSAFGVFVQATVRHRIDAGTGENTSWALVTMGDTAAADRALGAPVVMAGSHPLMLTAFSRKQANASTGQMGAVQASDRKKKKKKSAALFFAENPELAVPIAVSSAATPRKKKRAAGARPESGSCNLHVRGVESTSEDALAALFARHGECVQVTVRRREDAEGKDTSWALVTMGSHRAAEAAFMATVVVSFPPPGPAV